MFITVFTAASHFSLFWARLIQSTSPHPDPWNPILTYIYIAVFQLVLFLQVCPTITLCISVLSSSSIAPDSNRVTVCGIWGRISLYLKSVTLHTLVRKLLRKLLRFVQQKQSLWLYASVMHEYWTTSNNFNFQNTLNFLLSLRHC